MGKPVTVLDPSEGTAGPTDHALVREVRRGDDHAFEVLYARYQRRIAAYVFGMVKDHGRAEDITQEVFVSALRRMRQTERPIAFKPWIYESAKNACLDAYRRGRRAEEVSFDADDRLSAADHGRLVATDPQPDDALAAKQDLDHLRGAFGGLSDSHHEILVMRELEGRSYKDIGERMGMSRPAVESTLFRARKRLTEEYDELASGERCVRVQATIAGVEDHRARLGVREQRKLAKHVAHCQPCRRLAAMAGLDVPVPVRSRVAGKLAGLLPIPAWLRLRRGGDEAAAAAGGGGGRGYSFASHLPAFSDAFHSGWGKAAAGAAALLVAGGGAAITQTTISSGDDRVAQPAAVEQSAAGSGDAADRSVTRPIAQAGKSQAASKRKSEQRQGAVARRGGDGDGGSERTNTESVGGGKPTPAAATPVGDGGGGGTAPGGPRGGGDDRAGGGGDRAPADQPKNPDTPQTPDVPGAVDDTTDAVQETVDNVDQTVQNATGNLGDTVGEAGSNLEKTLNEPQNLLPNVNETVNDAVGGVGETVNDAVNDLGTTVGGLLKPRGGG